MPILRDPASMPESPFLAQARPMDLMHTVREALSDLWGDDADLTFNQAMTATMVRLYDRQMSRSMSNQGVSARAVLTYF